MAKYDPAIFDRVRMVLELTIVGIVRDALQSEIAIADYASAMVACDEAEERDIEAGVLMELLRACQEAAEYVTEQVVPADVFRDRGTRQICEFNFRGDVPERLRKAMDAAVEAAIPGCLGTTPIGIAVAVKNLRVAR